VCPNADRGPRDFGENKINLKNKKTGFQTVFFFILSVYSLFLPNTAAFCDDENRLMGRKSYYRLANAYYNIIISDRKTVYDCSDRCAIVSRRYIVIVTRTNIFSCIRGMSAEPISNGMRFLRSLIRPVQ